LLAAGLVSAALLLHAAAGQGGKEWLSTIQPTPSGAVLMVLAGGLLSAAGVPRSVTAFAGGYAFGAWAGLALAMAAQLLGCAATTLWASLIGRDWARRRVAGRWARLHATLVRRPFTATLSLRLLPVGSNLLLNLAAGLAGIPLLPFMAATVLGYLPQTTIFALLGSGVHVDRTTQLALAATLFAASAALGVFLETRARRDMPLTTDN
jgi:uncharacterized membrane protein YdjX (TVP38/TMEM64 family)